MRRKNKKETKSTFLDPDTSVVYIEACMSRSTFI